MPRSSMTAIGIWRKIIFYLVLITIWELAYRLGVGYLKAWQPDGFPSPIKIMRVFLTLIQDHTLGSAVLTSVIRLAFGFGISLVLGFFLALILLRYKSLQENLSPLLLGLQALPNVTWVPMAILWFGLGESTILFVVVIGSTFAITLAVESGIKNVKSIYLKAAQTMGSKGLKTYRNVVFPAALPEIIGGLKQGWAFAWRGLIAGEMLTQVNGLGEILVAGRERADINQIIAIMVVIIILGLTVNKLVFERLEANIRYRWGLD